MASKSVSPADKSIDLPRRERDTKYHPAHPLTHKADQKIVKAARRAVTKHSGQRTARAAALLALLDMTPKDAPERPGLVLSLAYLITDSDKYVISPSRVEVSYALACGDKPTGQEWYLMAGNQFADSTTELALLRYSETILYQQAQGVRFRPIAQDSNATAAAWVEAATTERERTAQILRDKGYNV